MKLNGTKMYLVGLVCHSLEHQHLLSLLLDLVIHPIHPFHVIQMDLVLLFVLFLFNNDMIITQHVKFDSYVYNQQCWMNIPFSDTLPDSPFGPSGPSISMKGEKFIIVSID